MYTKEQIFKQLRDMNAPRDSIVHMHTSLRAVGEVEGRGEGLLDILIEYFTAEGGIFTVPTHTWANLGKREEMPTLDLSCHETCIGTFPNLASAHKDAVRSLHPTHSMVAFGDRKKVEEFLRADEKSDSSTNPDGCYGNLYKQAGKVLLVGVVHANNTYLHCVEEMLDIPGRISDWHVDVEIKLLDGSIQKRKLRHHIGGVSDRFPKYEPYFREADCIVDGFIGDAKVQLCDAIGMKNAIEAIYKTGRDVILEE